jgi:hypothetical protein
MQNGSVDITLTPIELAAHNQHPGIKGGAQDSKGDENQACAHFISLQVTG